MRRPETERHTRRVPEDAAPAIIAAQSGPVTLDDAAHLDHTVESVLEIVDLDVEARSRRRPCSRRRRPLKPTDAPAVILDDPVVRAQLRIREGLRERPTRQRGVELLEPLWIGGLDLPPAAHAPMLRIDGNVRAARTPARPGTVHMRRSRVLSPQSLSEKDRRTVAAWAADCAERVLPLFEEEAPSDERPREAITRARAFSRGEVDAAGEIRRRFIAGRAAGSVASAAAVAAARSAAQASGVAHMGAHALGAAAYAVKAVSINRPMNAETELDWQVHQMTAEVRQALFLLPPVGKDSAGPFAAGGLLARGILGSTIRELQARIAVEG